MKVLIADDDSMVLRLLDKLLGKWGYETVCASDGQAAYDIIQNPETRPSIALLDWVMPGLEGPEVCQKVKADHSSSFIYVILLTGRSNESDIVTGLNSGADDYISKPIKAEELKSRIAVGVRSIEYEKRLSEANRKLQDQNATLEKYARIMETLAEERAKQLVHAERLSTIGEMAAGIAHEINNYLSPVLGYAEMLDMKLDKDRYEPKENLETYKSYLDCIVKGAHRIRNLVERIRKHSRKTSGGRTLCSINDVIRQSLELSSSKIKCLRLEVALAASQPQVMADPQELEQVFVNLFKNA